jgi:lysophospholipase L1-like esterase
MLMKRKVKLILYQGCPFLIIVMLFFLGCSSRKNSAAEQENRERERLISASQAGAMPLFFDPSESTIPVINPGDFNNPKELLLRNGLPNFFSKAKKGQALLVGYIGGSITRGHNLYRTQSAKFIQGLYPAIQMKFINAGISGTGTDLGACRIQEQLLQYKPDLIFIEFAVNNAFPEGLEGMMRQIWQSNPYTDICLLYTIYNGQSKIYASGEIPANIAGLEKIADRYQIPSIHMGLEASFLEKEGKLIWKAETGTKTDRLVFSNDGTHPLEAGGNLYAAAMARSILKMKNHVEVIKHVFPDPLNADNWEDAKMFAPEDIASFSREWTKINPIIYTDFKQFSGWFPYVMKAEKPGASFSFKFKGKMIGIFDVGGPEAGQLILEIDGKRASIHKQTGTLALKADESSGPSDPINRFNFFCNNRYRGQAEFFEVPPGIHTVTFTVSGQIADKKQILGEKQLTDITNNPAKYNQTVIYIGKILIRGEMIKTTIINTKK